MKALREDDQAIVREYSERWGRSRFSTNFRVILMMAEYKRNGPRGGQSALINSSEDPALSVTGHHRSLAPSQSSFVNCVGGLRA